MAEQRRGKHRTVEYDVHEVEPGIWRWNIYSGNRKIQGPAEFRTFKRAAAACIAEINDGIERTLIYETRRRPG